MKKQFLSRKCNCRYVNIEKSFTSLYSIAKPYILIINFYQKDMADFFVCEVFFNFLRNKTEKPFNLKDDKKAGKTA